MENNFAPKDIQGREAEIYNQFLEMRKKKFLESGEFPQTEQEVKWFEEAYPPTEESEENLKRFEAYQILNWMKLAVYLREEKSQGKTEFRIAFKGDREIYVHPLGKDGKTIDLKI